MPCFLYCSTNTKKSPLLGYRYKTETLTGDRHRTNTNESDAHTKLSTYLSGNTDFGQIEDIQKEIKNSNLDSFRQTNIRGGLWCQSLMHRGHILAPPLKFL